MKTTFLIIIFTAFGYGLGMNWQFGSVADKLTTTQWQMWDANTMPLPTIEQVQQAIGAKVDGKIGNETKIKWDRAICDLYASRSDYMYEVNK